MIPNLPPTKVIATKNGSDYIITNEYYQFLSGLVTALQRSLSPEGLSVPQQSSANISILNNPKSTGTFVYDNELHEVLVNLNGTYKTVQTS